MRIKEFELFHGAVLTQVLRKDTSVSFCLIETNPRSNWSTYRLNDAVNLFITYSLVPRKITIQGGGTSWTFNITRNQLLQIGRDTKKTFIALALGRSQIDLKKKPMYVCLLKPEHITQVLDFSKETESITVRFTAKKFYIFNEKVPNFAVPQNSLATWEIPTL